MKRFLLLMVFLPVLSYGQTEQKVLYMTVSRMSGGDLTAKLSDDADFIGPMLNLATSQFVVGSTSTRRSRVKDIRFEVRTETVDAIEGVRCEDEDGQGETAVYNLSGQRLDAKSLPKGIYIRNGKKYLK